MYGYRKAGQMQYLTGACQAGNGMFQNPNIMRLEVFWRMNTLSTTMPEFLNP